MNNIVLVYLMASIIICFLPEKATEPSGTSQVPSGGIYIAGADVENGFQQINQNTDSLYLDNSLNSLGIITEDVIVDPEFCYDNWVYSVTVPSGTKALELNPVPSSPFAKIANISGTELNEDGTGTIQITVEAGNKEPFTYFLNVQEDFELVVPEGEATLEKALKTDLNITDRNLKYSDINRIQLLDLPEIGLTEISMLAYMKNLKHLLLRENNITDLSPLSELTNLELLDLYGNNISDISALSGLTNLQYVILASNSIKNIDALSGMSAMKILSLGSNKISDLHALSDMHDLTQLYLDDNLITDVSALANLESLEKLSLENNPVEDFSPLKELDTEIYINTENTENVANAKEATPLPTDNTSSEPGSSNANGDVNGAKGFMVFDSAGTLHYDAQVIDGQVLDSYGNPIPGCTINDDGYVEDGYFNVIDPMTGHVAEQ